MDYEKEIHQLHYELADKTNALRTISKLAKTISKLTAGNPAVQMLLDLIQDEIALS